MIARPDLVLYLTQLASADDSLSAIRHMDAIFAALEPDELAAYKPLIEAMLQRIDDIDRLKSAADRDELTGVGNRRGLSSAAARELARHKRNGETLSVLVLDMDGLKPINDFHGHAAGDLAIREMAAACEETLRESDYLARTGGDEFVVLLPDTGLEDARRVAARLRLAVAERSFPYGVLGVSIGSASSENGLRRLDDLLSEADDNLYRDKRSRKEAAAWETGSSVHRVLSDEERAA